MITQDLIFIFKWWITFLIIGISFIPITAKIFNNFYDKGYIFSKIIGVVLISYVIYLLSSLKILKFTEINLFLIWIIFIIISYLVNKKTDKKNFNLKSLIKIIFFQEIIFFLCLIFWSYIRSFSPDIHGLEKFMDFGFINSILRSEYLPPKDMWLTPHSINYYYFGHLYTAVITKMTNIPSYISFNLMIATIFSFTFTMALSIGSNLIFKISNFSKRKIVLSGILFGLFLSFAGNLQTIYAFLKNYTGEEFAPPFWKLELLLNSFPNSYWYPNATRFIYRTIHEFPSYSFVVADLHGHVLSIPIVLTIIASLLAIFYKQKVSFLNTIFISFLISIAYMTNAWDGLIYLGLFGITIICINIFKVEKDFNITKKLNKIFTRSIISSITLLIFFFSFSYIFNSNFVPFASGIGLNCSPEKLIEIGKIGPFIFEENQCQTTPFWQILILYGLFIFSIFSFLIFLKNKTINLSDYFVIVISFFSLLLILIPEIFYLKDIYASYFRANTMFKLSYQAYIMFSISSIYIFLRILHDFKLKKKNKKNIAIFSYFIFPGVILLSLASIYSFFSIPSGYGNLEKIKNLNGIMYLEQLKPDDYKSINWLNKNINGQPVILEAQGDSYTDFARISANTGLPTVLGWTVHEWLWRGSYEVPSSRFNDIESLFETKDINKTKKLISKYNISLIYIGDMEREKYKVNELKFQRLGKVIYRSNKTVIYKIIY